jgi:hypothetical protein
MHPSLDEEPHSSRRPTSSLEDETVERGPHGSTDRVQQNRACRPRSAEPRVPADDKGCGHSPITVNSGSRCHWPVQSVFIMIIQERVTMHAGAWIDVDDGRGNEQITESEVCRLLRAGPGVARRVLVRAGRSHPGGRLHSRRCGVATRTRLTAARAGSPRVGDPSIVLRTTFVSPTQVRASGSVLTLL